MSTFCASQIFPLPFPFLRPRPHSGVALRRRLPLHARHLGARALAHLRDSRDAHERAGPRIQIDF
eukprot:78537-Pleurochrysis_carterae.AAC.1